MGEASKQELLERHRQDDAALLEIIDMRSSIYRLFNTVFFKELTEEQIKVFSELDLEDMGEMDATFAEGAHEVKRYFRRMRSEMHEELAVDYAHIFYAAGSSKHEKRAVPYESVFTSRDGLLMQEARDKVYHYMLDEHVEPDEQLHIPEDHIAFILDFMAVMSERAARAVRKGDYAEAKRSLEVQKRFHAEHLLTWIDRLCDAIESCCRTKFYGGFSKMMRSYVKIDAELMDECLRLL